MTKKGINWWFHNLLHFFLNSQYVMTINSLALLLNSTSVILRTPDEAIVVWNLLKN